MIKKSLLAIGLAGLASPAMAGGVAVCFGSTEGRDGLTDFTAYTVAQSDAPNINRHMLEDEAERSFRASYAENQRIDCRSYTGGGSYVVVRAAQGLNGRVMQLLGFGFGATREDALSDSRRNLDEFPDYHMFLGRGGQLEIVEEGTVDS